MACFLTLSVLKSTTQLIRSLIVPNIFPSAVSEDLRTLFSVITEINAAFSVAEGRKFLDQSEQLRLSEVKEIAYCAEDVITECGYEVLQAGVRHTNQTGTELVMSDDLVGRLRVVVVKFEEYSKKHNFHVIIKIPSQTVPMLGATAIRPTSSVPELYELHFGREQEKQKIIDLLFSVDSSTGPVSVLPIVGRKQEKQKIIDLLLSDDKSTSPVSVLPIVGQAGLGKTTLAQLIYKDPIISCKFDLRGWVNVSDVFSITTITRNILRSFGKKTCTIKDQSRLQKELVRQLTGKRFFIVLDDVHHENESLWESFLAPFLYAQSGKIIITTRNTSTAKIVQTMPQFDLESLHLMDCWSMFEESAVRSLDINSRVNVLKSCKIIVAECRGLPLFVKAVASALQFEGNQSWMNVSQRFLTKSSSSGDETCPLLEICYECMSVSLKQCFLFLALYPCNYVFCKKDVIKLWMSVGLLEKEGNEPVDVGSWVFDELLERAMVEPAHCNYGINDGFLVHGLVHDLARSLAGKDFAVVRGDCLHDISSDVRYLSIIVPDLPENIDLQPLKRCTHLRLLQILNQGNIWKYGGVKIAILSEIFQQLNKLRCLILKDTQLETLPDSLGNLKLLQYLDLTNTCIERLPQSICHLYYLKVLEITNCPLKELPQGIQNMVNLQTLNFQKSFGLCMPHGMGNLINLRTLPRFDVKRGSWHCALSGLKDLVNLKGELFIARLGDQTSVEEAKEANLQNKIHLEALTLDWSTEPSRTCSHSNELSRLDQGLTQFGDEVFESLRPHTNLRELHIHEYCGSKFPSWLGDPSFHRLAKISLIGGHDTCEVLPPLGQILSLRNLSFQSLSSIKRIGSEFSSGVRATNGFISLLTLEFLGMPIWYEWTGVKNGEFCCLRTLKLVDCPKLQVLPESLSSSLTKLIVTDCGMLFRLPRLPSLRSLSLSGKISDRIFGFLDLPLIGTLKVGQSRNIRSLPLNMVKLLSLERLIIHGCQNLQSVVGVGVLCSLKVLKISACQNLQISLNEKIPSTLWRLGISNCPKLLTWKKIQNIKYYAQKKDQKIPDVYCDEVIDEDEHSDQPQGSAKKYKGKQPVEFNDSETWSDDDSE